MTVGQGPGGDGEHEADGGLFAEINITPLTDIFLVLLVIFMVTSSVITAGGAGAKAGLKVNLPQSGTAPRLDAAPQDLSVALLVDGRLLLGGTIVTKEELATALGQAHAETPGGIVVIQADEGVPHGHVVEIMELARRAGLEQLAIGVRAE